MKLRKVRIALAASILSALSIVAPASAEPSFSSVHRPSAGPARVIGSYARGCISGAVALPLEGPGYEAIRISRNRYWGHPGTIAFIQTFGRQVQAAGLGTVYIGDISQPRGGRMSLDHASHQIGLDVDIWFELSPKPKLPASARENPLLRTLVLPREGGIDTSVWQPGHAQLLRIASESPAVDRIFVNKWIKRQLCQTVRGNRAWLHKITPWYGHDEHFHVRLVCPADSPECITQAPVPPGDGCGKALDDWFLPPPPRPAIPRPPVRPRPPQYPASCQAVLKAP
jgi:penicillin-insensitive murein endopeptidase